MPLLPSAVGFTDNGFTFHTYVEPILGDRPGATQVEWLFRHARPDQIPQMQQFCRKRLEEVRDEQGAIDWKKAIDGILAVLRVAAPIGRELGRPFAPDDGDRINRILSTPIFVRPLRMITTDGREINECDDGAGVRPMEREVIWKGSSLVKASEGMRTFYRVLFGADCAAYRHIVVKGSPGKDRVSVTDAFSAQERALIDGLLLDLRDRRVGHAALVSCLSQWPRSVGELLRCRRKDVKLLDDNSAVRFTLSWLTEDTGHPPYVDMFRNVSIMQQYLAMTARWGPDSNVWRRGRRGDGLTNAAASVIVTSMDIEIDDWGIRRLRLSHLLETAVRCGWTTYDIQKYGGYKSDATPRQIFEATRDPSRAKALEASGKTDAALLPEERCPNPACMATQSPSWAACPYCAPPQRRLPVED